MIEKFQNRRERIWEMQLQQLQAMWTVCFDLGWKVSFLDFVYWLRERSDVYETSVFLPEMINITNKIIYFRNVSMFKSIVEKFLPIYLEYLYTMTFSYNL